jgi:hypothetical protein
MNNQSVNLQSYPCLYQSIPNSALDIEEMVLRAACIKVTEQQIIAFKITGCYNFRFRVLGSSTAVFITKPSYKG